MSKPEIVLEKGIPAGNVYDKYHTRNRIARALMRGFLDAFTDLVRATGADQVHEVGCGEGELSLHLVGLGKRVRATDFSERIVEQARRNAERAGLTADQIEIEVADIYRLRPPADAAPLVVCCEVLEHLEEPERAVEVLGRLARPHLIASVPREPIWRLLNMARGKYLADFGNTPGHVRHWSRKRFLELLAEHFDVVAVRTPLPWTMALCRTRRG